MNYMDEQGMKLNSYAKRGGVSLKINQKLRDNLDINLDTRYSDMRTMGDEGTTNGSGSLLSSSYRFRPIATRDILGDLNALREGNMEMYGRQSTWDTYSPVARIGDYDPLYIKQRLRGTLSLNWRLFDGFAYHTDFTLNQSWEQDKIWGGLFIIIIWMTKQEPNYMREMWNIQSVTVGDCVGRIQSVMTSIFYLNSIV